MRQKHLESALSSLQREFPSPNVTLEQYPTSPHLTASVVLAALSRNDLGPGRSTLDLGCGTGILAIGCALVDCDFVLGIDCDQKALSVAAENVNDMELEDQIELILAKVKDVGRKTVSSTKRPQNRGGGRGRKGRGSGGRTRSTPETMELILSDDDGVPLQSNCVDTVLTNPPFGTKNNAGMDVRFLRTATRLARRAVYSFHKTATRDFLMGKVKEWGMEAEVVAEMKFDISNTYKFHKEKSVDVEVDLLRVQVCFEDEDDDIEQEAEEGEDFRYDSYGE